jgi:hypothetical protein
LGGLSGPGPAHAPAGEGDLGDELEFEVVLRVELANAEVEEFAQRRGGSFSRMNIFSEVSPCSMAFMEEMSLPSMDTGPLVLAPLRRAISALVRVAIPGRG